MPFPNISTVLFQPAKNIYFTFLLPPAVGNLFALAPVWRVEDGKKWNEANINTVKIAVPTRL